MFKAVKAYIIWNTIRGRIIIFILIVLLSFGIFSCSTTNQSITTTIATSPTTSTYTTTNTSIINTTSTAVIIPTTTSLYIPQSHVVYLAASANVSWNMYGGLYTNELRLGAVQGSAIYYAYLYFDLSSIPKGATINSVVFKYYVTSGNVTSFQIKHLDSSWAELSFIPPSAGPIIASGQATKYGYNSVDITNGFRAWHNGSITNNGFGIYGLNELEDMIIFDSRYGTNPPYLEVTYIY